MNFCSRCGHKVEMRIPPGDQQLRAVCPNCGEIHYQNPKIITGCLPLYQDQVLLCRRAIEPRLGLWTLPAGFMENGETMQQGAQRETHEEALAQVRIMQFYTLFNLPQINQVYVFFIGRMSTPEFGAGAESLETALFHEAQIPWEALAFPVVTETLKFYFQDREQNHFKPRVGDISWKDRDRQNYVVEMLS